MEIRELLSLHYSYNNPINKHLEDRETIFTNRHEQVQTIATRRNLLATTRRTNSVHTLWSSSLMIDIYRFVRSRTEESKAD